MKTGGIFAAGFLSLPEVVMAPPTFMPGAIPIFRVLFQFVGRRVSIEKNLA
jgi:hypothetical protein